MIDVKKINIRLIYFVPKAFTKKRNICNVDIKLNKKKKNHENKIKTRNNYVLRAYRFIV